MKPERIQIRFDELEGWILVKETQTFGPEKPTAIWTAFEMADHLEACELVAVLGKIADQHCACPQIEVTRNYVFVTATTPDVGLTDADFDFARAVDVEIGWGQKAKCLVGK